MSILGPDGRPISSPPTAPAAPTNALAAINNNYWYWVQGISGTPFQNPDSLRISDYEEMVDTDETVFSGIEYVTLAALARLGEYSNEIDEHQEFILECFERMEGSFENAVAEILSAIWAGYSVTEKILRYDNRRVMLDGLQTLHPASVTLDMGRPEDGARKNKLKQILQFYGGGTEQILIPQDKVIVYSHRMRFGNLYGKSRLKAAYKSWWLKDVALKAWGLTLNRYGSPHVVGKASSGNVMVNGEPMDSFTYLTKMLDSLSAKGSLVIDPQTEVEFLWPLRTFGNDFEQFVAYCNKMIYRSLLLPSLVADHGSTGSYSLGEKHFDLFALGLEQLLKEVIEVLLEQLVRPLIEMNFGPQEQYGEFTIENFQAEDKKLLSEVFANLVNTGILSTQRLEDINYMRLEMGLAELNPEDLEESLPQMPLPGPEDSEEEAKPGQGAPADKQQFAITWGGRKKRRTRKQMEGWRAKAAKHRDDFAA